MTPGARVAAAIEILESMATGLAAEQALTRWARRSRFAGSKDRAAIRDHIFDVLRCRTEVTEAGGGETGRAMMLGLLYLQGIDPATVFTGESHAPPPLAPDEPAELRAQAGADTPWNLPAWLIPVFKDALGPKAYPTARALKDRAPVGLRVNIAKTSLDAARDTLAAAGVETALNPLCTSALIVLEGARKIRNSNAYLDGLVELQDAASQAVVAALPEGGKVLDYCAGGGGKSLALAMDTTRIVYAHDINPQRMRDLPARAKRAGANITQLSSDRLQKTQYDIVLCDAPCSGSGAWRRAPEGKWSLTPERLAELTTIQDRILQDAAQLVTPGGVLAYATCSVLHSENEQRIDAFLNANPGWRKTFSRHFHVDSHGDGFFTTHLTQE